MLTHTTYLLAEPGHASSKGLHPHFCRRILAYRRVGQLLDGYQAQATRLITEQPVQMVQGPRAFRCMIGTAEVKGTQHTRTDCSNESLSRFTSTT